jgi:arylsulfatase A
MFSFRTAILLVLVVFAYGSSPACAAGKSSKPNIIFILADDLGMDGVGCYGADRKTPNIDALAKTGVRFETCYSAPLCGPSRCLAMTGRYAFRTGGLTNKSWSKGPGAQSRDEISIAKLLQQFGYKTGMGGKWRQMGETPRNWGFDEYLTDGTPSGWFWQKSYIKNGMTVTHDKDVYCPDAVHDFAIDFINRHKDEPFFFYYSTHLVHAPILRTPDTKPGTTSGKDLYNDNIAYMDKQVGLLVKELEKLKLLENTLIVFSGDNGTVSGHRSLIGGRLVQGSKGTMLEGGSRVPLIASWKGVAPAGKVVKDLTDFSDFFATFADVAGAPLPKNVTIDGQSFAPQLRGEAGRPREWIYVQLGDQWFVRSQGWKLSQKGELFDMKDAPFAQKLVPADTADAAAKAGRETLQAVLNRLNPAAGKTEKAKKKGTAKS